MQFFVVKLFKSRLISPSSLITAGRLNRRSWHLGMLLILLPITLPACHLKKHKKRAIAPLSSPSNFIRYQLEIAGIECTECIRAIIRNLHKNTPCAYIECRCPKKNVSNAHINCFIDQEKLFPLQQITELVSTEHFRLTKITGAYRGILCEKEQKLLFTPQESSLTLDLVRDARYNQALPEASAIPITLYGTIDLDKHLFIVHERPPQDIPKII